MARLASERRLLALAASLMCLWPPLGGAEAFGKYLQAAAARGHGRNRVVTNAEEEEKHMESASDGGDESGGGGGGRDTVQSIEVMAAVLLASLFAVFICIYVCFLQCWWRLSDRNRKKQVRIKIIFYRT